jgi:Domain of unknown function (DUF1906)
MIRFVTRNFSRLLVAALTSLSLGSGLVFVSWSDASATVVTLYQLGFDACSAPTTAQLSTWISASPYYWLGVYYAGANRSCANPNVTTGWVNTVIAQGWGIEPIYVGLQDPCWTNGTLWFSSNASTAFTQGETQAASAKSGLAGIGMSTSTAGNDAVVFDMEGYINSGACLAAEESFVEGWDTTLASSPSQVHGIYGSTESSYLGAITGSPEPNFIWGADADGDSNTADMPGVPAGDWATNSRLKQYTSTHLETHGGVTLSIDNDNADGPVYY